jgi:hypothetical protein
LLLVKELLDSILINEIVNINLSDIVIQYILLLTSIQFSLKNVLSYKHIFLLIAAIKHSCHLSEEAINTDGALATIAGPEDELLFGRLSFFC